MADHNVFAYCFPNPAQRTQRLVCRDLRHYMSPYQHDIIRAEIQGITDINTVSWDTGTPIRFRYGRSPNGYNDFYGYVMSTKRIWAQNEKAATGSRLMEVHAIGASWPLKDAYQDVWSGVTAAQVVQAVGATEYFDVDAVDNGYVWPNLHVSSTSLWKFLVDLAKRSGCTFYCNQTQLRFYDPATLLSRPVTQIPTFYEKDSGQNETVISMNTDNTEIPSAEGRRKRNRIVQSVSTTGSSIYATDDPTNQTTPLGARQTEPAFNEYASDLVVRTQNDANALLPNVTTENRYYIRATATLSGAKTVTQDSPILIQGLGPRDNGMWQVIDVVHHIKNQYYALECNLGRDSDFDSGVRPTLAVNLARAYLDASQTIVFGRPPTKLVNSRWRTAYTMSKAVT